MGYMHHELTLLTPPQRVSLYTTLSHFVVDAIEHAVDVFGHGDGVGRVKGLCPHRVSQEEHVLQHAFKNHQEARRARCPQGKNMIAYMLTTSTYTNAFPYRKTSIGVCSWNSVRVYLFGRCCSEFGAVWPVAPVA